jgi:fructose-1,6-bisphosphatase/inositol monophosphatase family enzyme
MNLDELLECAVEAANIGAAELQKHFRGPLQIATKTSAADYVTNADLESETTFRGAVRRTRRALAHS